MIDTVAKSRSIRACRFGGRAGAHEVARDKLPRRAARFGRVAALVLAAAALAPSAGLAQNQNGARAAGVTVQTGAGVHAGEFVVPVNKSQILRLDVPFTDISVGNAKIADVLALTNRTLYVLGKAIGTTSLTIFGPNRRLIAVADLVVTFDIEGVKARLNEMMPGETVEVRPLGNSVVLSGMVSSAERAERAATIANRYAPGAVTNMLRVGSAQQVMLAVRFAEVKRSALKRVGINLLALSKDGVTFGALGSTGFDVGTGIGAGLDADPGFLRGILGISIGSYTIQALFDALESKGFSRTLAEPTLVALSGDTASFLAGGEFPYQIVEDNSVEIVFKQFGISLDFTPTVLDRNRINLVVKPEVSNLDFDTSAALDIGVPALSTRRAATTVELGDGQSFAIAGLIQNNFDDNIQQVPWLGNVPILGALFRSSDFLRSETELVMVVTPHIVKPVSPDRIVLPTDRFMPPSEKDFFLMGKIREPVAAAAPASAPGGRMTGGIAGPHGHIVE